MVKVDGRDQPHSDPDAMPTAGIPEREGNAAATA
jgi:hypothetical protein